MDSQDVLIFLSVVISLILILIATLSFIRNLLFSFSKWRHWFKSYIKKLWDIFWEWDNEDKNTK